MLLLLFFFLSLLLLFKTSLAEPQLTLNIPLSTVAYFNLTFEVTSTDGFPLINCSIDCADEPLSSIAYQMTSSTAYVQVPVPAPEYIGPCTASVSARGYDSVYQDVFVLNYTQCQPFDFTAPYENRFSKTSSISFIANYTLPGPLGYIFADKYQIDIDHDLYWNQIRSQVSKDSSSLIFFQSDCDDSNTIDIKIVDPASYDLSDCSNYYTGNTFFPYTPFYDIYWMEAQGAFNFTTFVTPDALFDAQASIQFSVQICLAANYIVADVPLYLVPESVLTFNVSLGLSQSMAAAGAANLTCGSLRTRSTFNLTSDPKTITLETPDATPGEQCSFYIYNDPEVNAYAAPVNVILTVDSLLLTVPTTTVKAGDLLSFAISALSDPETSFPVVVNLYCSDLFVGGQIVLTSNVTQYFTVPNTAVGICQFNSTGSNTIDITVNQQLSFASSLTDWTSGSSVPVNISSPNLEDVQTLLTTTCTVGTFSANVMTATDTAYPLPSNINGFQCVLTTSNLPPFYLPIPETYVSIAIGAELTQQIIQQISPASFVEASDQPNANGLLKRLKNVFLSGRRVL